MLGISLLGGVALGCLGGFVIGQRFEARQGNVRWERDAANAKLRIAQDRLRAMQGKVEGLEAEKTELNESLEVLVASVSELRGNTTKLHQRTVLLAEELDKLQSGEHPRVH